MTKESFEELIWQDIDGTIAPDDRERLEAYLNGDPRARELFEELSRFSKVLGEVEEVDPPAELRGRIVQAVSKVELGGAPNAGIVASVRAFVTPVWSRRLAAAAAAGVLIGIVGYHLLGSDLRRGAKLDPAQLYGTIDFGAQTDGWLDIAVTGVEGTLKFRKNRSFIFSELDLTSDRAIRVELKYPGESLFRYGGIEQSDEVSNHVTVASDGITLTNAGAGKYFLIFEMQEEPAPVVVRILSDERVLWEDTIHPGEIPNVN